MNHKGIIIGGMLAAIFFTGILSPAYAQASTDQMGWAIFTAKIAMAFSLTVSLTASAIGLVIAFQSLLGAGEENFYRNIAVALMPSTQGIYAMVVFITNLDNFATDPYTVIAKAVIISLALPVSAWYQGIVCATGIKSIMEGRNTLANAMVSAAMPETYAVFALVMTFIIR